MEQEQYDLAIESFSYIHDYKDANYRSVLCAMLSHKYRNTPIDKLLAFEGAPEAGSLFHYWVGLVQLKRFLLAEADQSFNRFLNEVSSVDGLDEYKADANAKLKLITSASDQSSIFPFEGPINSRNAEMPGVLLADESQLVFLSDRNSEGKFEIFKTDKTKSGWGKPAVISNVPISTEMLDVLSVKESLVLFDPTQQHLYTVQLSDQGWDVTDDEDLPFLKDASHIYVNEYKTRIIFSKPNGTKGLDLFESFKLRSTGEWLQPTPIPGLANSPYDEDYPFLTDDRKRLYFSSNRPGGVGKYDIYFVEKDPETSMWGNPVNAGIPINSVDDDISFSMTSESKALISSDRIFSTGDLDLFVVDVKN